MKNVLCFGDSNTYGLKPDGTGRFDRSVRWTGRLEQLLGSDRFHVIEEGLCGRTSVFEDALRKNRRGIDVLPMILETHKPIDLVVIMLGTNDCKTRYHASAKVIAKGIELLANQVKQVLDKNVKILLVSPIHLGQGVWEEKYDMEFSKESYQVSLKLPKQIERVALENGYEYIAASDHTEPSATDREHLDEKGHEILGRVFADRILDIYNEEQVVNL